MELQAMVWKEGKFYVIKEVITGVVTQGKTIEEAIKNIKEAVGLYLEEVPEAKQELKAVKKVGTISVELA